MKEERLTEEMADLCLSIVYHYGADRCGNCPAHEYVDQYREPDEQMTDAGFPDDWDKWTDADWDLLDEGIRIAMGTISELIWGV